jgi:hypothetical protein
MTKLQESVNFRKVVALVKKHYGVKVRLMKTGVASGYADLVGGEAVVSKNLNVNIAIAVVFHEVGHFHCYRNGIWSGYHRFCAGESTDKKSFLSTAYRAELWVDKWAEKEMYKYFPRLKFKCSYRTKSDKKWLMKYLNIMT